MMSLSSKVREVSNRILTTPNSDVVSDSVFTHLLPSFGQWTDHDQTLAPHSPVIRSFSNGLDCDESCERTEPCFPILVSHLPYCLAHTAHPQTQTHSPHLALGADSQGWPALWQAGVHPFFPINGNMWIRPHRGHLWRCHCAATAEFPHVLP